MCNAVHRLICHRTIWLLLFVALAVLNTSCQQLSPNQLLLPSVGSSQSPESFQIQTLSSAEPSPTQMPQILVQQDLRGINYYPQNHPWQKFWQDYPRAQIEADLTKIEALGLNTVRIFVFYELFGGANVNPTMKAQLHDFLNRAQNHHLQVIVTLFDQYSLYAPEHYPAAQIHLQSLTQGLENHPAILAWDLKNESDLDYPHYGQNTVKNWLKRMQRELKTRVSQPITASYADAAAMGSEVADLDYLTFHYYGREEAFAATVAQLRQRFPEQPLVLGEFGYHTWANRPGDAHPQAHQFNYYNAILAQAQKSELAGYLVWTLYDFPQAFDDIPFLQGESYNHHLGLFDINGQAKPGLKALQQSAHIVDADNGASITPLSQHFELVLHLNIPQDIKLERVHGSEHSTLWQGNLPAGNHALPFALSASERDQVLSLAAQLQLSSSTDAPPQVLLLRQD